MSIKMMAQVWESDIPPEQKYVLLKLADYADDSGAHIYPAVKTVALFTGLSERSVQRHMAELRRVGVLEVMAPATRYRPTEYLIRGDRLTPLRGDTGDVSGVTLMTARGDTGDVSGVTPVSPYPSLEPLKNHHKNRGRINRIVQMDVEWAARRYTVGKEEMPRA